MVGRFLSSKPSHLPRYYEDFGLDFGKPVRNITLESLIEAEEEWVKSWEEEELKIKNEEAVHRRELDNMSPEQRIKYRVENKIF